MLPAIIRRKMLPDWAEEFFGTNFFTGDFIASSVPSVNVTESDESYKIDVVAPGLDKKDFTIEIDNNVLSISSQKQNGSEKKEDGKIIYREFNFNTFRRTFSIPENIDTEKISAEHKNGILSVVLPKKEEAKIKPVKQIAIK